MELSLIIINVYKSIPNYLLMILHTSSEKSLSYCFFTLFIEERAVFSMIDLAGTLSNWNESKNVLSNSWKSLSRYIRMMMLEQRANMSVMECFKNPLVQMIRTTFRNNVKIFLGNIVTKEEFLQFSNMVRKIKIKRNDSNQSSIENEELSREMDRSENKNSDVQILDGEMNDLMTDDPIIENPSPPMNISENLSSPFIETLNLGQNSLQIQSANQSAMNRLYKPRKTKQIIFEPPYQPNKKKKERSSISSLFNGITFCVSGDFSKTHTELKEIIEQHSGKFLPNFSGKVKILISNDANVKDLQNKKIQNAMQHNVAIVSEGFIHDSIEQDKLQDVNKYILQ